MEGIVLGHLVSSRGIEVDKAKAFYQEIQQNHLATVQAASKRCGFYLRPALRGSFLGAEVCDASNFALGAVLGQRVDKQPHVIAYALRTTNPAQINYTTTEKELLAIIFVLDKFCSYLLGFKILVFSNHATLKFLLKKPDAKLRLIRWMLLLQQFNLEIRDKKSVENVVDKQKSEFMQKLLNVVKCRLTTSRLKCNWVDLDGRPIRTIDMIPA
ncbi:Retrovirus-related Pol polyprotein from transposon 17.6, partial [Mucuna pruriens]